MNCTFYPCTFYFALLEGKPYEDHIIGIDKSFTYPWSHKLLGGTGHRGHMPNLA